ncbi:MAG: mechanosensitive ion channel family protein [Thermoleophilia bacterium]|nr:mechanosensitive ion channel family protein [Thermoleophilia bacterium]
MLDVLLDNESVAGRLATTAAVLVFALLVALIASRLAGRRSEDQYARYYLRKGARYVVFFITLVVLAVVWRPFAGQIGVVLGFIAAGIAFAMQEVIGALAGWFNIVLGRIFRVGDRVEMGGVRGDVIDITPLRTKILEMGSALTGAGSDAPRDSWVGGRQYTGRIVAVSNKMTFTQPVFNYSAAFDYIWEEVTLPIPYRADWRRAEEIILDEVRAASSSRGAQEAMERMAASYPVPKTELEPRVFARATDDWMALAARFIVPVRAARSTKGEVTRRIVGRLQDAGIEVASQTMTVTMDEPKEEPSEPSPKAG